MILLKEILQLLMFLSFWPLWARAVKADLKEVDPTAPDSLTRWIFGSVAMLALALFALWHHPGLLTSAVFAIVLIIYFIIGFSVWIGVTATLLDPSEDYEYE